MRGAARSIVAISTTRTRAREAGATSWDRTELRPSLIQRNTRAPSAASRCSSAAHQRRPSSSVNTRTPPDDRCGGLRVEALCTAPPQVRSSKTCEEAERVSSRANSRDAWGVGRGTWDVERSRFVRHLRTGYEKGPAEPAEPLSLCLHGDGAAIRGVSRRRNRTRERRLRGGDRAWTRSARRRAR
jgi:hypothetical protein